MSITAVCTNKCWCRNKLWNVGEKRVFDTKEEVEAHGHFEPIEKPIKEPKSRSTITRKEKANDKS